MSILIYKTRTIDGSTNSSLPSCCDNTIIWRPSIFSFTPPLLNKKYIFWWFSHYIGIFRNKDYAAVIVKKENETVGIIVLTPAYSRWKFMGKDDLQITNVHVNQEYRGRGIAYNMMKIAFEKFSRKGRAFWYITNEDNNASIRLCEKAGFQFVGEGKKINRTGIKGFHEIELIIDTIKPK